MKSQQWRRQGLEPQLLEDGRDGVSKTGQAAVFRDYKQRHLFTIWLFNIAMENGPFIDGLPIKNGDFPWLC